MKKIIAILLCATALQAQDHLKNFRNKTAKQIANVSHLLRMDTTFFHVRIGEKGRDLAAAIEGRGLTPYDFATIKAALDTSIFRQNRLYFPPGTFTVDSLGIYSPITLSGVGIKRIKTTDTSPYYGSVIKSTNSAGLRLFTAMESGVHLRDVSFQGTKANGHGVYFQRLPVSGNISTTLGGYSITRVNSFNHGGDGFHLVGADGVILNGLETNGNMGYGLSIVSPTYDGLTNSGNTAGGTTNLVMVGRHRANKLGGVRIGDQAAPLLLGVQAIADTSMGIWLDRGRSRAWLLGIDSELQVPANTANPRTIGLRLENYNGLYMGQSFVGASHTYGSFVADAGTDTTTIVDASLINYGVDDFLVGSEVNNTTRSSGKIKITDYVASTGTITLASAIAGQTTGDSYKLTKKVNVAVLVDSLKSGIFVNNNMAHSGDADTTFGVSGYGYATFVNNINFDPLDNAKTIGGATFKWLNYNLSDVDSLSGGDARVTSNTEVHLISSDSLVFRSTGSSKGIRIDAESGRVGIQPSAEGDVRLFENVGDDENPDLKVYYDADPTDGVVSQKWIGIGGSLSASNTLSIENIDSTQVVAFGTPVKFSGSSSERYFDIQNKSASATGGTPSNGFVRFWARGDTAYVTDDNGTTRSLYAGSGLGDVVGPASSTDNAVARFDGTTGKLVQNTSTTTLSDAGAFSFADGVTQTFNPNGTSAGLNVGSQTGDPSTPTNGDMWYDGTANELTARINGANVALGAGGGAPTSATYITQTADGTLSNEQALGSLATGVLASTTTTGVVASRTLTGTAGAVSVTNGDGSANPTFTLPAAITVPTSYAIGSDPADAGVLRLENAAVIGWEASPAGTDVTLTVDASEILQASGAFNTGGAITEVGNSVPNATDHLGFFAATTSSQLSGVVSDETGTGALVLGTSPTITTSLSQDGDVADTGYLRLQNAANIAWEASPAGTDVTLGVDASEILQSSTAINATALTEATNAVPNATDHLGFFSATTSAQLSGVLSDESGSGAAIFGTSPSLTTPSISGSVAMASGSAFNFNAGDVTVTHSANLLTVAGGDVEVPTEVYDATGWNGDNSVPTKDAVRDKIETISGGSSFDPSTTYERFEDWEAGTASTSGSMGSDWIRVITTSGTTSKEAGEAGAPGIMRLFCANSAGSTASLHTDADTYILNGPYVVKARVRFSTLGTAGSNGAYYRVGFMDDMVAAIPTDGAWIEFNVDSSATRWRAVTANGGTRTITTYTGSTVSAATWYKLTITPNSDATSIVFAVDGTTIATHTTNIPTGAVGLSLVSAAVTASTTKFMSNDYIWIKNSSMSR